jgi:hypothetical protein
LDPIIDLILYNGRVHTMDERQPTAQAVAVCADRILAVGSDAQLLRLAGPGTNRVDLEQRAVTPGFVDSHLHVMDMVLLRQGADLHGASSPDEVLQRVQAAAARVPPEGWVLGFGWDQYLWPNPTLPDKKPLDAMWPQQPVLLHRVDGHSAWLNSAALLRLGVGPVSPDPPGGAIGRDPRSGELTGILYDAALFQVLDKVPLPDAAALPELIRETLQDCQRAGLTGVHDAIWEAGTFRQSMAAYQVLRQRAGLPVRILAMLPASCLERAIQLGLRSGWGDAWLRLGGVKLFADGSLCSQTALVHQPYLGRPGYHGLAVTAKAELQELVGQAARAGIGAHVHAIGDWAIDTVLDVFEELLPYRASLALPHRIEHGTLLGAAARRRAAHLGCLVAYQPLHITDDMHVSECHWGVERSSYAYPLRANLDAGVTMAFGSDCPVADYHPLKGVHAAVTRQNAAGWPPGGWHPEQRIGVGEAVWGYTMGAAIASGEADSKGSITPGKLADMVVLSEDIFRQEPDILLDAGVDLIVLAGKAIRYG